MSYTIPTLRSTGNLITASIYNTDIINNIIAIVAGLLGQGFAAVDLLGATLPALSSAGHAVIASDANGIVFVSSSGGAYTPLGAFLPSNSAIVSRHRDVVRY